MGDVKLEHANMLESPLVNEIMAHADIVLVDNKLFGEKCESPPLPSFDYFSGLNMGFYSQRINSP